jgi:spore coat polysaccharide biosynthesis predicted glycosyltransferase SpsG
LKIIYFYIYSKKYGSGHYKRAISHKIFFQNKSHTCKIKELKINNIFKEKKIFFFDYIFLDITNEKLFKSKIFLKKIINFINFYKDKIVIIDGLGRYQLNNQNWKKCNSVIYPYFCSKNDFTKKKGVKYFAGYKYMVKNFITKSTKIKKEVNNILFTSGGSDLNNSSYKFIRLFSKLNLHNVKLHMIQGIFAKKENFTKIRKFADSKKIDIKILKFKKNIKYNLKNIDLVISSSGITKYDLINASIPMIIYSENKLFDKLNNSFKLINLCPNLSNLNVNKKNIDRIKQYILNYNLRLKTLNKIKKLQVNKFNNILKYLDGAK